MVLAAPVAAPLGAQQSGSFDLSGVQRFWEVADIPGRGFFREKLSLAFHPARRAERDRAREGDRYLRHYERVAASRTRLDSSAGALRESAVSARAVSLTRELLPHPGEADPPPVSFVIFANDARGAPDVVVDLLATEAFDLIPFLAHGDVPLPDRDPGESQPGPARAGRPRRENSGRVSASSDAAARPTLAHDSGSRRYHVRLPTGIQGSPYFPRMKEAGSFPVPCPERRRRSVPEPRDVLRTYLSSSIE